MTKIKCLLSIILPFLLTQTALANNFNVTTPPLGFLYGYDLQMEIKFNPHITAGPWLSKVDYQETIDASEVKLAGYGFGGRINYYFSEALKENSWYIGAVFYNMDLDLSTKTIFVTQSTITQTSTDNITATGKTSGNIYGFMIGYQWIWDNFNMNLGLGITTSDFDDLQVEITDGTQTATGTLDLPLLTKPAEFTLGFAF